MAKKEFPFIKRGKRLTHRSAKGSKLRYHVDKVCEDLTIQELESTYTPNTELEKETLELLISNAESYDSFESFLEDLLTNPHPLG